MWTHVTLQGRLQGVSLLYYMQLEPTFGMSQALLRLTNTLNPSQPFRHLATLHSLPMSPSGTAQGTQGPLPHPLLRFFSPWKANGINDLQRNPFGSHCSPRGSMVKALLSPRPKPCWLERVPTGAI